MRPLLLLVLAACTPTADPDGTDTTSGTGDTADTAPASARWPACDPTATTQTLSLVHLNDMHGSYNADPAVPGESVVSRAVGWMRQVQRENPYTLWTNGGDDFEKGSIIEDLSEGRATTELVQAMQFDVRAIGNHDFSFGEEVSVAHTQDDRAVVLASNATYVGSDPDAWKAVDRVVLEIGCLRVGLFSLNTPPWITKGHCTPGSDGPCHYLPGVVEHDYDFTTRAQALVDALSEEADVVVSLNHLGGSGDKAIAGQIQGIDVALGSHSHEFTALPQRVDQTYVVQAGSNNRYVLRLDLEVDLETREIVGADFVPIANQPDNGLEVADDVEAAAAEIFTRWAPELWRPVACTSTVLPKEATAALYAHVARVQGEADAALIQTGWLRQGLPGGPTNVQDYFDLVPVEREPPGSPAITSLHRVTMTGAHLKAAIAADEADHTYEGPEASALVDDQDYAVVVHKRQAELPLLFMPGRPVVEVKTSEKVGETWAAFLAYAQAREAACLHLDADTPRPGCTPKG
ncbi:MAG: metallophosphoesterase [Alphaproteobacteria bacterium]|nr:metallophosphoesterase [Alphaproteobacteria bacterium]